MEWQHPSIPKNLFRIDLADFASRYSGRTGPKLPEIWSAGSSRLLCLGLRRKVMKSELQCTVNLLSMYLCWIESLPDYRIPPNRIFNSSLSSELFVRLLLLPHEYTDSHHPFLHTRWIVTILQRPFVMNRCAIRSWYLRYYTVLGVGMLTQFSEVLVFQVGDEWSRQWRFIRISSALEAILFQVQSINNRLLALVLIDNGIAWHWCTDRHRWSMWRIEHHRNHTIKSF